MRPIFFFLFLAAFIAIGILFTLRDTLQASLSRIGLVQHEEGLTELYFTDSDTLPTRAGPATFSFTIHNLEGTVIDYTYVIMAESEGSSTELDQGVVSLPPGESIQISKSLRIPQGSTRLTVTLPDIDQHISFLVR